MQVKKFEAKTMKDALELVKVHLGPEAIILSAKDSHRGFGLMGEKSVEVTAAVSDETLRKKKIAEARLREDLRARFQQIPAAKQKEFINKVFNETRELVTADGQAAAVAKQKISSDTRAQLKGMRYIDIDDEEEQQNQNEQGRERVRRAAAAASQGMAAFAEPKPKAKKPVQQAAKVPQAAVQAQHEAQAQMNAQIAQVQLQSSVEVQALQSQVRELKSLVEQFQKIPQLPLTMHPGAEQGLPFELSAMYQRLTTQGVNPQLVTGMLKKAMKEIDPDSIKKPSMVDAWMVRNILNSVEVSKSPLQGRYQVFMGCTGQGKTSTLVKFASNLLLKEKKTIAIISLDTIKVGAADQLKIYAQILNVPFAIVRSPEEWQVAQQKLAHVQHILVDCPGFNLNTMEEGNWLKRMIPPAEFNRQIHYVQSILARDEETFDIAGRYQMLGFHDVIFTRLDESSRQGLILNFQERFKVPLHSFGTGSRIPEDYEFATKERVVDFLFKLTKVSKREE